MHLNAMTKQDISAAVDIHRAAVLEVCAPDYGTEICEQWASTITAQSYNGFEKGTYYKIEIDEELAAIGGWEGDNLKLFYLHPKHVGQGLAAQFFAELEEKYKQQKPSAWHVMANLTAVPFYVRMDFEKLQESTFTLINGLKIPVMIMTKRYV